MYGTAHTSTIPTVSSTVGPTYATQVNACISEIRATLDAKVTPAGFAMDADLSFLNSGVYYRAKDLHSAKFQAAAALSAATYPTSVYVNTAGELFYNDSSSRQIQLTNAGAVNVTTTGGITGAGYGSGGVEVNWDSGAGKYKFKSGSGTDAYAALEADDVLLRDGSGNAIRLASPALASDYTATLPSAVPGAQVLLQMDTSGNITASNSLASNQSVTLSGTGRYKHGDQVLVIDASSGRKEDADTVSQYNSSDSGWSVNNAKSIHFPLILPVGARVKSVKVGLTDTGGVSKEISLRSWVATTGYTSISSPTSSTSGTAIFVTFDVTDTTLAADTIYQIRYTSGAGVTVVFGLLVTYDFP